MQTLSWALRTNGVSHLVPFFFFNLELTGSGGAIVDRSTESVGCAKEENGGNKRRAEELHRHRRLKRDFREQRTKK